MGTPSKKGISALAHELLRRHQSGELTNKQVADMLGVHPGTVSRWIADYGYQLTDKAKRNGALSRGGRRKKQPTELARELLNRHSNGDIDLGAIAEALHVSMPTLLRWRTQLGFDSIRQQRKPAPLESLSTEQLHTLQQYQRGEAVIEDVAAIFGCSSTRTAYYLIKVYGFAKGHRRLTPHISITRRYGQERIDLLIEKCRAGVITSYLGVGRELNIVAKSAKVIANQLGIEFPKYKTKVEDRPGAEQALADYKRGLLMDEDAVAKAVGCTETAARMFLRRQGVYRSKGTPALPEEVSQALSNLAPALSEEQHAKQLIDQYVRVEIDLPTFARGTGKSRPDARAFLAQHGIKIRTNGKKKPAVDEKAWTEVLELHKKKQLKSYGHAARILGVNDKQANCLLSDIGIRIEEKPKVVINPEAAARAIALYKSGQLTSYDATADYLGCRPWDAFNLLRSAGVIRRARVRKSELRVRLASDEALRIVLDLEKIMKNTKLETIGGNNGYFGPPSSSPQY